MRILFTGLAFCAMLSAQQSAPDLKPRSAEAPPSDVYRVDEGTHVLLTLTNSVSTRSAHVGDRVYAKTSFPVLVNQHIIIPEGSYVNGTITDVARGKRMFRGKAQIQVRFDSIILPNGVTRDFRSDLGSVDGKSKETLDREHSTVQAASNKGETAKTVATTTAVGAGLGTMVGAASGHALGGLGIGSAAGAAAGLAGVAMSRGPDAELTAGSTVEMVTNRPLEFKASELATGSAVIQVNAQNATQPENRGFKPAQ